MENYQIPPEDCLILRAFKETQSLREAANLLKCDSAGLTRKVQHISSEYGLIQKVNNRWQLTSAGIDLVNWTEHSIQSQKKIISGKNNIRLATNMWLVEILIPHFKKLKTAFDSQTQFSFSVPNKNFEIALLEGSIDFVLACHPPESPEIEHRKLLDEEWIIIVPKTWKINSNNLIQELETKPFVRHTDMNIELFIPELVNQNLVEALTIDNLIGIRTAVIQGLGWSIVPKIAVKQQLKEQLLHEVSYNISTEDRKICLWWLRHRFDSRKAVTKIAPWIKSIN